VSRRPRAGRRRVCRVTARVCQRFGSGAVVGQSEPTMRGGPL